MSDDTSKLSRDRKRIALGEEYEVRYWTEKLGISREQLEAVVKRVGNGAEEVEKEVKGNR